MQQTLRQWPPSTDFRIEAISYIGIMLVSEGKNRIDYNGTPIKDEDNFVSLDAMRFRELIHIILA